MSASTDATRSDHDALKIDVSCLVDVLPDHVVQRVKRGVPLVCVLIADEERLELREIDPDQVWFWTPEWQEGERQVDAEIAEGRGTIYCSGEEFLAALETDMTPPQ